MNHSAKILLLGKTGVGKSAFINYYLGKEVARSAAGKPVTREYFIPYEIEGGSYPIEIYDTKGLEALGAHDQLNKIIDGIKMRNNSDDIYNWFHTIFYCVSMADARFEDFEVKFIQRLQQDLTQHIHIILTQCDTCEKSSIARMRERIKKLLGSQDNIEIFEVVCISKKKRNGEIVQPCGREIISERVFDLLLEDIAYKISCDYAISLREAMINVADRALCQIDVFIDTTVKFETLIELIQDDDSAGMRVENIMDQTVQQIEQDIAAVQQNTNHRFNQILQPAAQLYMSYRDVVTDSFVDDVLLDFDEMMFWCDTDWIDSIDENDMIKKIMPNTCQYMDADGTLNIDESFFGILKGITSCIGDLLNMKKNFKRFCRDIYLNFIGCIPSESKLQKEAYERIIEFVKQ